MFDVFISYSRKDYVDDAGNVIPNNMLLKIIDNLKANGISYWFDKEGIYSGDEFASILTQAIRNSSVFLFVSSINSNSSKWTSNEISTALEFKKPVIPFRIDDSPYNDSVMMKIISFDYIECKDEEKAISKLLRAIKHHLPISIEILCDNSKPNVNSNLRYSDAFMLGLRKGNYGLASHSGKATSDDINDMKSQLSAWYLPRNKVDPLLRPGMGMDFLNSIIDIIGEYWGNIYENCAYLGTTYMFCFASKKGGDATTWNERFVQICQKIGIPQHIFQRISHIDAEGMMSFRDVLRQTLDNLDNSVTKCQCCGARVGFDYQKCPICGFSPE